MPKKKRRGSAPEVSESVAPSESEASPEVSGNHLAVAGPDAPAVKVPEGSLLSRHWARRDVLLKIYGLLLLSAVLMFLGFAGFGIWPLGFVAMLPALFVFDPLETRGGFDRPAFDRAGGRAFFWRALFFGTVAYAGGFYWIEYTLRLFSGFHYTLSTLFSTIFWSFQGLQFVLMLWVFRRARKNGWPAAFALPVGYLAAEQAFPMLFEHYYGSALLSVPALVQVAELGGPELATLVTMLPAGALYDVLSAWSKKERISRTGPAVAVGYLVFVVVFGVWRIGVIEDRMEAAPTMVIGVVQPNLGLFDRFEDPRESLAAEVEVSREIERLSSPDLIVWPESSVQFWMDDVRNVRRRFMPGLSTPVLFGGIRHGEMGPGGRRRQHNTAFLTDGAGEIIGTYDKTYLLAFGEYLPFGDTFPVLYDISENSGQFSPGDHVEPLELPLASDAERGERPEVVRIGTLICYEDIVSGFVRYAVNEGDPHVLINMTVDSWFGPTQEPHVHLGLAAFRAIEHRRYLIRATNSGISAAIDPIGRLHDETPLFERASFAHEVRLLSGHTTLFEQLGHWPGYLALGLAALALVRRRDALFTKKPS